MPNPLWRRRHDRSVRALRGDDAAVPRPRPHGGGERRGGVASRRVRDCRRRYRFEESLRVYVRQATTEQMPAELRQKLAALRIPLDWESTSPGGVRSSQGTSLAGSDSRPRRGCSPTPRARGDGVEADAAVARRDDVAAVCAPVLDDAVDRARVEIGPVGEHDDCGFDFGGSAASPQRSEAPGPRSHSGARTLSTGSGCAPLTTTISSTLLSRAPRAPRQQLDLLRRIRPVARRRASGEDDGDNGHVAVSDTKTCPNSTSPGFVAPGNVPTDGPAHRDRSRYQLPGRVASPG